MELDCVEAGDIKRRTEAHKMHGYLWSTLTHTPGATSSAKNIVIFSNGQQNVKATFYADVVLADRSGNEVRRFQEYVTIGPAGFHGAIERRFENEFAINKDEFLRIAQVIVDFRLGGVTTFQIKKLCP